MEERDQRKRAIFNELTQIDYVNRAYYWQDTDAYDYFTNYLDKNPVEPPLEDDPDLLILF